MENVFSLLLLLIREIYVKVKKGAKLEQQHNILKTSREGKVHLSCSHSLPKGELW